MSFDKLLTENEDTEHELCDTYKGRYLDVCFGKGRKMWYGMYDYKTLTYGHLTRDLARTALLDELRSL